jgi:hypothetical protein
MYAIVVINNNGIPRTYVVEDKVIDEIVSYFDQQEFFGYIDSFEVIEA